MQALSILSMNKIIILLLPCFLLQGTDAVINGPLKLTISLMSEHSRGVDTDNVAMECSFDFGGKDDSFKLSSVKDGVRNVIESYEGGKLFSNSLFELTIVILRRRGDSDELEEYDFHFFDGNNFLGAVESKFHMNSVRYLVLTGDFERVTKFNIDYGDYSTNIAP